MHISSTTYGFPHFLQTGQPPPPPWACSEITESSCAQTPSLHLPVVASISLLPWLLKLHSPEWQVKQLHCAFSASKNKKRNNNCSCGIGLLAKQMRCLMSLWCFLLNLIYHQIESSQPSWCVRAAALWLTVCFSSCSWESETPTAAKKQEWTRKGLFLLIGAFIMQYTGGKA